MSIQYDSYYNSDSDNYAEFDDINLACNKLSMQWLTNNFTTSTKKYYVNKTDQEVGEVLKANFT